MSDSEQKPVPMGLKVPADVRDLLEAAQRATGSSFNDLIIGAVKKQLPEVVRELFERRQKDAKLFFSRYPADEGSSKAVSSRKKIQAQGSG